MHRSDGLNRVSMDLRQLRYFLQVAQTGNLTRASSKAWVSQSALSRQIQLLEEELGVSLFVRQSRGVEITHEGTALVRQVEVLLSQVDNLKQAVRSAKQEPVGTLRLGTPTSLRARLVAPFLAQYQKRYPSVLLVHTQGTSKGLRDGLAEGAVDLAIVSNQESLTPFSVRPLFTESLCRIGPAVEQRHQVKSVTVRQLANHPLILTSHPNALRLLVDRAAAKVGRRIKPVMEVDDASMMFELVSRGIGYAVLPASAVFHLAQPQLSAVAIQGLRIEWVLAQSKERTQTVASERAVEMLHSLCHQESAGPSV
jgi:LysR family transcriptional regulator, nitrogen assimilation regulatory protein